jgi:hypothetical protein
VTGVEIIAVACGASVVGVAVIVKSTLDFARWTLTEDRLSDPVERRRAELKRRCVELERRRKELVTRSAHEVAGADTWNKLNEYINQVDRQIDELDKAAQDTP